MKAVWHNQVVAESDDTVVVEGNHYFPRTALDSALVTPSDTTTYCPWKGHGALLRSGRRRRDEPGCGLVLPGTETGGERDRRPRRLLARR